MHSTKQERKEKEKEKKKAALQFLQNLTKKHNQSLY